ncbi:Gfo/Idh/MocA family protein [Sphingomonas sp. R86520]|uniref:Gfo/Idh/MocA family protein n=1 Tax=Sphingomonas sp. R86520 TaxID=3093859 RepID=UPI0036D37B80
MVMIESEDQGMRLMEAVRNIAVVGLGKMGVSHLSIANATPGMKVVAICDTSAMIGGMIGKYTKLPFYPQYDDVLAVPDLDGVIIATPTRHHEAMIRRALAGKLHVFCEKPLTLSAATSTELAQIASEQNLAAQVGYHNRFVGTFAEVKRLLDLGTIGKIRHVHADAYGPVVLKPAAKTWRSKPTEGGGCLYDYAAHPINLMNWYLGKPVFCTGAQLTKQWSEDVDDAIYSNLMFPGGVSGQVSVNWADETIRKMTTSLTLWGDGGKISVDRQEVRVYVGDKGKVSAGYRPKWTVRNITDLTPHPAFYLRGEEYSAQLEGFVSAMNDPATGYVNSFVSGAETDHTLGMIRSAADGIREPVVPIAVAAVKRPKATMLARAFGY